MHFIGRYRPLKKRCDLILHLSSPNKAISWSVDLPLKASALEQLSPAGLIIAVDAIHKIRKVLKAIRSGDIVGNELKVPDVNANLSRKIKFM